MEELLNQIGITAKGEISKHGAYVVDIKDYDEYGKYFSLLDKSDLVQEVPDTAQLTIYITNITYVSDNYQITLLADLEEESYKLVVTNY